MSFATILARIRGEQPRWEDVASLFELQGMKGKIVSGNSAISEASTSSVKMFETQISGVESDDLIILVAGMSLSHQIENGRIATFATIGPSGSSTTGVTNWFTQRGLGNSLGTDTGPTLMHFATGFTGTIDCSVWWSVSSGGSGYSNRRWMYVLSTKYQGGL